VGDAYACHICYASENEPFARLAEMMLKEAGYDVWRDERKLHAGEEWRTAIDEAIKNCDAMAVVITPESCASKYVTYEWAFALGYGTKVIPLLVTTAEVHPRLAVLQRLDFTDRRAMPWDKLFREIDTADTRQHSASEPVRVGDMTPGQLQDMIAGAVSLAAATAKTAGHVAAREDISRAAKNVVDVMQQAKQTGTKTASAARRRILWVDDRPDNNVYEREAFESMGFCQQVRLCLYLRRKNSLRLFPTWEDERAREKVTFCWTNCEARETKRRSSFTLGQTLLNTSAKQRNTAHKG
jgi:hypothetical protein